MARNRIKILFFFEHPVTLADRKPLKKFLSRILTEEGDKVEGEVRVVFCSDEYLLAVNREFLKHDYYTDIITFLYSEEDSYVVDAELYISVERVKENAKQMKVSLKAELHRVLFHGCLHLCGFGDKTDKEISTMRNAENNLLNQYFGVSRGTSNKKNREESST